MVSTLLDPEHCPPNHSSGASTEGAEGSRGGGVGDIELWRCVLALRTAPGRAEAAGPAGGSGGIPGPPLPPCLPGRARAGVQRGGGPVRPHAAVQRFRADPRRRTARHRPEHPSTAVWCLRVHVPVTLGSPGRESREGTGRPYPHPGAAIPGAALRARECARTELALPRFRESRTLPPLHRRRSRPHDGPLSRSLPPSPVLPSRPAYSGTRAPEFRSWGSRTRS